MSALTERGAHAQVLELQAGVAHLQSICGDDPELLADMIEGELSVESILSKLIAMITEDEADALGLKLYRDKISIRKKRLEERASRLRILVASLVNSLPSRRFRNELASVRVFDIDPSVIVEEEADIPVKFWKQAEPVIDLPAIRKHLNERRKLSRSAVGLPQRRGEGRGGWPRSTASSPTCRAAVSTMATSPSQSRWPEMGEAFRPTLVPPPSSAPVTRRLDQKAARSGVGHEPGPFAARVRPVHRDGPRARPVAAVSPGLCHCLQQGPARAAANGDRHHDCRPARHRRPLRHLSTRRPAGPHRLR